MHFYCVDIEYDKTIMLKFPINLKKILSTLDTDSMKSLLF